MNAFFCYNFRFIHFFHGVKVPIFFHHDTPNFSKPTFADDVVELKVRSTNLNIIKFLLVLLLDDDLVLFFMPVGELREIDFQAVLRLLEGFLTEGGVASSVILFNFLSRRCQDYALLATGLMDT